MAAGWEKEEMEMRGKGFEAIRDFDILGKRYAFTLVFKRKFSFCFF